MVTNIIMTMMMVKKKNNTRSIKDINKLASKPACRYY